MVTTQDTLSSLLERFNAAQGTMGAALITRDGLPLVSALPPVVNREGFAAMVATMLGAGETAASDLESASDTRAVLLHGEYRIAAAGAGPEIIVVVLARAGHAVEDLLSAATELAESVRKAI